MSRTVRTTPRRLRVHEGWSASMSLYDLRYASAELIEAAREGRRPVPTGRLHRITSWDLLGLDGRTGSFSVEAATAESRARQRLRREARRVRGLHRAGQGVDDVDIPPVRHRHGVLWMA